MTPSDAFPPPPAAGPPPYGAPPPRPDRGRLRRSTSDRVVAGVCGGLADYFGIDPVLVRVLTAVALVVTFPVVPIAYAVLWMVLPADDPARDTAGYGWAPIVAVLVLAFVVLPLAGLLLAAVTTGHLFFGPVVGVEMLLLLVVLGGLALAFLLARRGHAASGRPAAQPYPTAQPTAYPTAEPSAYPTAQPSAYPTAEPSAPNAAPDATEPPLPGVTPWWGPPPAPRPTPRSPLVAVTFSAMLLVTGLALLLDYAELLDVSGANVVATALVVVGGGLTVGAFRGGGRPLVPLAVVLAVGLAATTAVTGAPPRSGAHHIRPRSWSELPSSYHRTAGRLTVDLSRLDAAEARNLVQGTLEVGVTFGRLLLVVPRDLDVVAYVGAGRMDVFGERSRGTALQYGSRGHATAHPFPEIDVPFERPFVVDAHVRLGHLEVRRAA